MLDRRPQSLLEEFKLNHKVNLKYSVTRPHIIWCVDYSSGVDSLSRFKQKNVSSKICNYIRALQSNPILRKKSGKVAKKSKKFHLFSKNLKILKENFVCKTNARFFILLLDGRDKSRGGSTSVTDQRTTGQRQTEILVSYIG